MKLYSKHKLRFLLISNCLLYLLGVNILHAQNDLGFEHLTTENGLSENVVYSIFQDSKGFLWIGTHDGLNRYDGYGFKKFRYNPSDSNSLPGNSISCICEDGQGNIWFVTSGGLCRYNYANGRFSRVVIQDGFNLSDIQQVITVNTNELMIRLTDNLYLLDIHTLKKTAINFQGSSALKVRIVTPIPLSKDKKGNIYLMKKASGSGRIWQYDNTQKIFVELITLPINKELLNEGIESFLIDNDGSCWIGTNGKGKLFHSGSAKDSLTLSLIENNLGTIRSIYEDNTGNIWIAANTGLLFYDHATGKISRFQHSSSATTITSDIVNVVYQDKTGIVWTGTFNGLNKLNPLKRRFMHLTANTDAHPALRNNFVLGIYAGSVNSGLIRYTFDAPYFSELDLQKNSIHHYFIEDYNFADYLKQVVIKNSGYLNDNTFNKLLPFLKKIPRNALTPGRLIADDKQGLWYNSGSAFMFVNTMEWWSFKSYTSYTVDMQLNGDDIWLATAGDGLLCFHIPTHTITRYISGEMKTGSISSNDITCFVVENNGNMWIGTKGGGLNYFDREKKTFQHYTEENGLCNNSIYCMVKDNRGRIWIGTSNGLSCFDQVTHKFSNYYRSDGLVNSEYNRYSACKLENGFVLMGGMNGLDYFQPDSLINNSTKPQVQITDFKVFNKSIYPGGNFSLGYNENSISIDFAAMDFSNPAGNKFAYKLDGVDKDWVQLENRNFATYSILSPGSYHFSVKAANSDGIWNDDPQTIEFTILTPWWQSRWFYTFCALTIAALLFAFYRYRINQLKKVLAMRTKISQDLHDEVGATLSSIHVYSSVAAKTMEVDSGKAKDALQQINENTRQVMENMSDIVWAINANNMGGTTLAGKLKNYGYELLTPLNIQCIYRIDKEAEKKLVNIEARKNILLIAKEAMNNIAKYSNATEAMVRLEFAGKNLQLEITDNGKGLAPNNNRVGNGLNNMKNRTESLGGLFRFSSAENKGTAVRCSIPLTSISD